MILSRQHIYNKNNNAEININMDIRMFYAINF